MTLLRPNPPSLDFEIIFLIEIERAPNMNVSIGKYTDQDSHLSAKLTRNPAGGMLIIKAKTPTRKSFKACYAYLK